MGSDRYVAQVVFPMQVRFLAFLVGRKKTEYIGAGFRLILCSGDEFDGDDSPLAYMRFLFFAMFAGTAVTVMSGERRQNNGVPARDNLKYSEI